MTMIFAILDNLVLLASWESWAAEPYRFVMTKWELSNTANLSVYWSLFRSWTIVMNFGNDWNNTTQIQSAEMRFLRRVHGMTLRDKVGSCEIRKTPNIEPLLRIERSYTLVRLCPSQNVLGKISETSLAGYTHGKAAQSSSKHHVEWLQPCFSRHGGEPAEVSKVTVDREVLGDLLVLLLSPPSPEEKRV